MKEIKKSKIPEYFKNPVHPITIGLIGVGGTGSQLLYCLARINSALVNLGHMGMMVYAFDGDKVSLSNIGRQLFFEPDVGQYKSRVIIERINRYYGFGWQGIESNYHFRGVASHYKNFNITITCVDTIAMRLKLGKHLSRSQSDNTPYDKRYYWLDIGNTVDKGQVIMSTVPSSKSKYAKLLPGGIYRLPSICDITDDFKGIKDDESGPSCSLAEALTKQNLFINSTLAQHAGNLIWKLFREPHLDAYGVYVNNVSMKVTPLRIATGK